MISTSNYSALPDRNRLRNICKSIAVIEAIIAEDWNDRYYTYNSKWAKNKEVASMRDGSGDEMLVLFTADGCVINGLAHEFYPKDKAKLTQGLPGIYNEFMFGEPVQTIGTTFCIWANSDGAWQIGQPESFADGSEGLLGIFDGQPETYIDWATDYYEDDFEANEDVLKTITDIYQGHTLTTAMVLTINKEFDHWEQLKEDLEEIDYPNELE
ncbi:hypothetical protein F0L74_25360 [Chitinophaga agrisoli]|uniref:Uncharacterized protein n=1 Tax=Chitinophaga agrisoli TaxID=2607653 RepID=A0A5B2VKD1_9BACT|nr:hypothetical protein [Chitinophaga agrisoli]KAA2239531.1 hypothetical protein F0L74_25360 [Chitinophaga agrisoli]